MLLGILCTALCGLFEALSDDIIFGGCYYVIIMGSTANEMIVGVISLHEKASLMLEMITVIALRVRFLVQMRSQLRETPPVQLMDANHMLN